MKARTVFLSVIAPLTVVAVLLAIWQIAVTMNDVSSLVLPKPSTIGHDLVDHADAYVEDGWVTLREAAAGFVIAIVIAFTLATAMVHSRFARLAIDPIQTAIRSTPVVALAPALVMWMGFGAAPKIAIAAIITFPPFLVNALTGLTRIDTATLEVLRSLGASPRDVFLKLRVPHALPYLFSAAKVCVSLALIGAVVGEWAGSSAGLGYRIVRAQSDLETATVWGATTALAVLGIGLTAIVALAERRLLRHHSHS